MGRPTDLAGWVAWTCTAWWLWAMPWRRRRRRELEAAAAEERERIIQEVLDRERKRHGCRPWCAAPAEHHDSGRLCVSLPLPHDCAPWCTYGRMHGGKCKPPAKRPDPRPAPPRRRSPLLEPAAPYTTELR